MMITMMITTSADMITTMTVEVITMTAGIFTMIVVIITTTTMIITMIAMIITMITMIITMTTMIITMTIIMTVDKTHNYKATKSDLQGYPSLFPFQWRVKFINIWLFLMSFLINNIYMNNYVYKK